jgi:two-component system OmpR family sensor kinase
MFSSLRARLWLSYALLIVTALAVVAIVLILFLLRNPLLYRQTFVRLSTAEQVLSAQTNPADGIETIAQSFNVRTLLFNTNGALIKDSGAGLPLLALPTRSLIPRPIPTVRDLTGRVWLYSLKKLADGNWLMVAAPRPQVVPVLAVLTDELSAPLLEGGLIALLLSLVLAFVISRWVADPLQRVIAAARTIPQDAIPPVSETGPHEVRELIRAFNFMLARVKSSQTSQRDFVANVSHELKTPLTSIQGFAQAIIDGTADTPEAQAQAAEVIYNEAGRMHRLALDLLDLARLDAGTADLKMSPVDMTALLTGVREKLSPLATTAGVNLKLSIQGKLPDLIGDGDRLAQVFTNLVDNAVKFTPREGKITIWAICNSGEIQVSVSDTGKGIPADAIPHIFDRFYQADTSRTGGEKHGAGLGLAIVNEIVIAHGGRISVRSAQGRGTGFIVHLPLTPSKK